MHQVLTRSLFTTFFTVLAIGMGVAFLSGKPDTFKVDHGSRSLDGVNPSIFSPDELKILKRRFGVHGPQTQLVQFFTKRLDQLVPLRVMTLDRIHELKPLILRESAILNVNPMLITAILFDEIQHSKPGESFPLVVHSGLLKTYGLAQLGISELIHQKILSESPTPDEVFWARNMLLDPEFNVKILVGKIHRIKLELGLSTSIPLQVNRSYNEAKSIATLSYLHNGKLDYPGRIMRYMQDPELHELIYSRQAEGPYLLI